jgi:GGDEF domain-containing protein
VAVKRTPALLAPALLLPLAAVAALAHKLPSSLAIALDAAPLLVFGAGALLGLVTRRARLMLGVVILALAASALMNVSSRSVFDAVALLLPLNLAVVVWLGDENPYSGRGALLFAITLLQTAAIAVLLNPGLAPLAEALDVPLVRARLGTWTSLSQLELFVFAAALALLALRFFRHGQSLAAGAAWALVASFLALDGVASGGQAGVHFAAAGGLLLVGATREPRHRVAVDGVTQLPMRIELQRAIRRLKRGYVLALVEVDDYGNFRQDHGATAAHRMLRLIARRLRQVGGGGHAFHCDGPMFAVLFPRTPLGVAVRQLEAVRATVEELTIDLSVAGPQPASRRVQAGTVERTLSVTISAGVTQTTPGTDPKQAFDAADRALARAREAGMNCVSH